MKHLGKQLSAAMWARVMLLWFVLGVGALVVGVITIQLSSFTRDNIREELKSQQIFFTEEDALSDEERDVDGIVENAGEQVLTGNQAEIYANLMSLHMSQAAERAGYPDASYASLGGVQRQLRAEVDAAQEAGDEEALAVAQAELDKVDGLRNTFLTGSNIRGNLYSAYGWDNIATGMAVVGAILILLAVAFFGLLFFEWRRGHIPVED